MYRGTRRRVLASTGAALATGLAGCSTGDNETTTDGDGGDGDDETTTDETTTAETTDGTGTTTDGEGNGGGESTTVVVGPNGDFRFAPNSITIAVGDTVEWTWASGGHNVVPDSIPGESDWSGSEGAPDTTHDSGFTHSHTFEVAGTYTYYCAPHRTAGMTGEIVVE